MKAIKKRVPDVARKYYGAAAEVAKGSKAVKIGAGIAIAGGGGFLAYEFYKAFTSPQGAGCSQLQDQLANVQKQQFVIINNDVKYHGGTVPSADQTKIATLQKEQAKLVKEIANQCTLPAGQQLQKSLDQVIAYTGWLALGLLIAGGVILSARATSWFLKKWGGSKTDPNTSPTTPDEADPPADFSMNTMSADASSGFTLTNVDDNIITPTDGLNVMSAYQATDPMVAEATSIEDAYTALAQEATLEELYVFFDDLAVAMETIETADDAIITDAIIDLVLAE